MKTTAEKMIKQSKRYKPTDGVITVAEDIAWVPVTKEDYNRFFKTEAYNEIMLAMKEGKTSAVFSWNQWSEASVNDERILKMIAVLHHHGFNVTVDIPDNNPKKKIDLGSGLDYFVDKIDSVEPTSQQRLNGFSHFKQSNGRGYLDMENIAWITVNWETRYGDPMQVKA